MELLGMLHVDLWFALWWKCVLYSFFAVFMLAVFCWYQCKTSPNNRWHWLEFHDQDICPHIFKQFVRRAIIYETVWKNTLFGPLPGVIATISPLVKQYRISLILDLCSGSCGPSAILNEHLNRDKSSDNDEDHSVTTILTDLFPQVASWKEFASQNRNLQFIEQPVDATNIDKEKILKLYGHQLKASQQQSMILRTVFFAFHHFPRNLCIRIFEDAFRNRDMLIIQDAAAHKSCFDFLLFAFAISMSAFPGSLKIIYLWLRPANKLGLNAFQRVVYPILLTVLFPLFLFAEAHDGLVSLARMYSEGQFKEMAQQALQNVNDGREYEFKHVPFGLQNEMVAFICIPQ